MVCELVHRVTALGLENHAKDSLVKDEVFHGCYF